MNPVVRDAELGRVVECSLARCRGVSRATINDDILERFFADVCVTTAARPGIIIVQLLLDLLSRYEGVNFLCHLCQASVDVVDCACHTASADDDDDALKHLLVKLVRAQPTCWEAEAQ